MRKFYFHSNQRTAFWTLKIVKELLESSPHYLLPKSRINGLLGGTMDTVDV